MRTAPHRELIFLGAVPLALGFAAFLVAAVWGLSVEGQSLGDYVLKGLLLLVPVVVFGVPLWLLGTGRLGRLPWLLVLIAATVVLSLALSAGPNLDALLYALVIGLAICVLLTGYEPPAQEADLQKAE